MSTTLGSIKRGVRALVGDLAPANTKFDDVLVNRLVNSWIDVMATEGVTGEAWNTSWITLVPGTWDYTVATEYAAIVDLKLTSQGWLLNRVSPSALEEMRQGGTSSGNPTDYCLIENTSQAVVVKVFPQPVLADTIEALLRATPTELALDSDIAYIGRVMARALVWFVASDLLGDSAPGAWRANAERALQREKERLGFQQAGSGFMPTMI